jgi:dephospho-CoA kinase
VASGKSAVAALLAEHGCAAIDADSVGHDVLELPHVQKQLVDRFGPRVLFEPAPGTEGSAGPRVNRRALGAIVFADPIARRALELIVHPLMRARFVEAIRSMVERGQGPVVLDAAILLEAGWRDLCDKVVFVDSPRSLRIRRAALQRGWSEAVFLAREQAQLPCEEKRRRADFIIRNDAGLDSLRREVEALLSELARLAASPVESCGPDGRLSAGPDAPPDAGPNASIRRLGRELAAATSRAPSVHRAPAAYRAAERYRQAGSGTDAWHRFCFAM